MSLLRPMVPIAFPGADPNFMSLALLGFTSFSGGWGENTTEGVLTQPFHEVGLFQVPAGDRGGPAPNPAGNAAYSQLAGSDLVRRMLGGRAATTAPDAWKGAHADQIAVGLANLLRDERSLRGALHGGVAGDASGWSQWRVFGMFTAFSRGPGQAARVLNAYARDLSTTPEALRLRKLRSLVAHDVETGASGIGGKHGKMGAAYAVVRSDQKLESGVAIGTELNLPGVGGFAERYVSPADDRTEDLIARGAYILTPGAVATAAVSAVSDAAQSAAASVVGAVTTGGLKGAITGGVLAVAAAIGGVALWRMSK
jgi:hypothetical protein